MKVKMLKCGTVKEVNECFGARLIEQGKAVLAPKTKEKAAEKKSGKEE